MTSEKIRKAARVWLKKVKTLPKTREGQAKLAAKFVDYLGTMNQSDRDFKDSDEYATDSWVDSETQDKSNDWKKDKYNEMGFGIPRTSSARRKKALAATKLAFMTLGEDVPDAVIEAQGRDFMAMPAKSLVASLTRLKKATSPTPGEEENPDLDTDVDDSLEETTDTGEHSDEDMEDSLEEASVDEDSVEDAIAKLDKGIEAAKKEIAKGKKSESEKENEEKEKNASKKKKAEVDEADVDAEIAEMLAEDENEEVEEEPEEEETEEAQDDEEMEEEEDVDVEEASEDEGDEEETLASIFEAEEEESEEKPKEAKKKTAKKRTASKNIKKLGGVSKLESGNKEVKQLEGLWDAPPRVDWGDFNKLDQSMV